MNIHIYYGDRPTVLHGRIVIIQNCQHLQSIVTFSIDLEDLKSHVMCLLHVNQHTHTLYLEVVRPRVIPNNSAIVHTLFELRRNNAWSLYAREAMEENFEMGVYVNLVPRMADPNGKPSSGVLGPNVAHEVEVGPVCEGSTSVQPDVVNEDEVPQPEVDAGGMDDEGGGSEDEEAADNDDPTPAIEYFCASGLVDSVVVDYNNLFAWGYQNNDIQTGQRFRSKEEVIYFISNFAVITRREHKCTKSKPGEYEVRCSCDLNCPFFVRAHKPKHENYFVVSRHTPHTCSEECVCCEVCCPTPH